MPMTDERWRFLLDYPREVFGGPDEQLDTYGKRAAAAGLPSIAVRHGIGQFLSLLASMTQGHLALELGTLGGFSGIWIARGLAPDGRLLTVEHERHHADFAASEFESAGLGDRVEIIVGSALDVLPGIAERVGPESLDFVFIDAIKEEYVDYWEAVRPLVAPGGLVTADNVYGTGAGWIDEGYGTEAFNRRVAADPDFQATIVHAGAGILIARRDS